MIGSNHLPECLRDRMVEVPIVVVEDPFDVRLERLREEYFDHHVGGLFCRLRRRSRLERGTARICTTACFAIRRRLGLQRFARIHRPTRFRVAGTATDRLHRRHFGWLAPAEPITTRCTAISWRKAEKIVLSRDVRRGCGLVESLKKSRVAGKSKTANWLPF